MSTEIEVDPTAACFRCGEKKAVSAFYADKSKASGRKAICKECDRAKSQAYYAANAPAVIARVTARATAQRGTAERNAGAEARDLHRPRGPRGAS